MRCVVPRASRRGVSELKNLILAAFAALGLTAGVAQMAHAAISGMPTGTYHQGPYDNTGNGPDSSGLEGGGG